MAGRGLTKRVDDLERGDEVFGGYAVAMVHRGQTLDEAKAEWVAENGPATGRTWVVFNMGGLTKCD